MDTKSYEENIHSIRDVGLYLRKSRGDEEKDLEKHRLELESLCVRNDWKYVTYEEIGTSDSINLRPQMMALLKDVADELYDAVVVIDIDRLSRGDEEDRGRYLNIFRATETYIATPEKIYNLADDNDDLHVSVKGLLAREEYKSINKRLKRGKKLGSRQGKWTNGIPPFPYEYEKWHDKYSEKSIVVNDDKLVTYRYIIDSCVIDKMPTTQIAWELNRQGILSPRGSKWHPATVRRLLVDETHLGYIITNKSKGGGRPKKSYEKPRAVMPKSEWVIVKNAHESCKTKEEHDTILLFLVRGKKKPTRSNVIIKPLTGIVECGLCGHTITVAIRPSRKSQESIKPCWHRDKLGNMCGNRGGSTEEIYEAIIEQLDIYENKIRDELNRNEAVDTSSIKKKINEQLSAIKTKEKSLERIYLAYEDQVYDLSTFKKRKEQIESQINSLTEGMEVLNIELNNAESITNKERLQHIKEFKRQIRNEDLTDKQKNEYYKSVINKVIWKRIGGDIEVNTIFL